MTDETPSSEENAESREGSDQVKAADSPAEDPDTEPVSDPGNDTVVIVPNVVVEEIVVLDAVPPQSADVAAASPGEVAAGENEQTKRGSRWSTSWAALQYVGTLADRYETKTRKADRATNILLLCTGLVAIGMVIWPHDTQFLRFTCDAMIGVVLLLYVTNRFGIITTLTPRQALLTWELMLVMLLCGMYLLCNLQFVIDALHDVYSSGSLK